MQCGLFLLLWFNAQVVKNAIYKGIIGNFIRTSYTFSWGVFGDSHTFFGRLFGSSHTFYGGLFGKSHTFYGRLLGIGLCGM